MTRREEPRALARKTPLKQRALALIDDGGPAHGEFDPATRVERIRHRDEAVIKTDPREEETFVELGFGHRRLELVHLGLCLALELWGWCGTAVDLWHRHAYRERTFTKAVWYVLRESNLRRQENGSKHTQSDWRHRVPTGKAIRPPRANAAANRMLRLRRYG